jgi:hypothetical protein
MKSTILNKAASYMLIKTETYYLKKNQSNFIKPVCLYKCKGSNFVIIFRYFEGMQSPDNNLRSFLFPVYHGKRK